MLQGTFYNGYNFFRFYKTGEFIHAVIKTDNPNKETFKMILSWFDLSSQMVQKGDYKFKNNTIEFSVSTYFGDRKIDYKGKASGKKITFESLNHNSGKKLKEVYFQLLM